MRNSIYLLTLALLFSFNLTGCSLFSSDDGEQETATVAETDQAQNDDEFASDEFEAGDDSDAEFGDDGDDDFDSEAMASDDSSGDSGSTELAADDVEVEDSFGGDEYADDDYGAGDGSASTTATTAEVSDEDFLDDDSFDDGSDSLVVDEGGGIPETTMTNNQEEDLFGQDMEPVVDTPAFADSSFDAMEPIADVPKFVSVKKMKPAVYSRAGANINRLYVVRQGDNMDNIAVKIYGDEARASDLYSYNSHFKGKTIKVGDKIYYSSPNNPNDQAMMTYYEDLGMQPQFYTSQDGDNIRKVAKQLLGHERSWMEIYATNDQLDSKGEIPGGLQLRYWPEGGAAPMMAQNDQPEMPEPEMTEPEPAPMPEPEPMEPDNMAMNEPEMPEPEEVNLDEPQEVANLDDQAMNEQPPQDQDFTPPPAAGSVSTPPPPPPKAIAPPPPPQANFNKPPKPRNAKRNGAVKDPLAAVTDDNMIMGALGGLLILAAIIMLIFIRRSRAKRVNFSQTQV